MTVTAELWVESVPFTEEAVEPPLLRTGISRSTSSPASAMPLLLPWRPARLSSSTVAGLSARDGDPFATTAIEL